MKIIFFWLENEIQNLEFKKDLDNKAEALKNNFFNIDVEIGPNLEEHELLMTEFNFYKKSYETKKFDSCSDVYKFWKLSQKSEEPVLYLDSTLLIDYAKLTKFFSTIENTQHTFLLETEYYFWTGLLFSNNGYKLFKKISRFYKRKKLPYIIPREVVLSKYIYKYYGNTFSERRKALFYDARLINPSGDSVFKYNYSSKWEDIELSKKSEHFQKWADFFEANKNTNKSILKIMFFNSFSLIYFYKKFSSIKLLKNIMDFIVFKIFRFKSF